MSSFKGWWEDIMTVLSLVMMFCLSPSTFWWSAWKFQKSFSREEAARRRHVGCTNFLKKYNWIEKLRSVLIVPAAAPYRWPLQLWSCSLLSGKAGLSDALLHFLCVILRLL